MGSYDLSAGKAELRSLRIRAAASPTTHPYVGIVHRLPLPGRISGSRRTPHGPDKEEDPPQADEPASGPRELGSWSQNRVERARDELDEPNED